jgi:hypothetical protein
MSILSDSQKSFLLLPLQSLSYSLTAKWFEGYGKEHYWVESVFRGFDQKGIDIFRNHSCVPEDHPFYCPQQNDNKNCIVNNFEHDLSLQYPCDKVHGLYPSDTPDTLVFKREVFRTTWIKNLRYWHFLVEQMGFPIAKVNEPEQVGSRNDMLLRNCTKYYPPPSEMFEGMNFDLAKPYFKHKWGELALNLRSSALKTLGYEKARWNSGCDTKALSQKKWDQLEDVQQDVLTSLGCSKMMFNRNECHRVDDSYSELE